MLLAAPPSLQRGTWVSNQELVDSSEQLAQAFLLLAEMLQIPFADTRTWEIPLTYDGVHFTEDGHRIFADQITKQLHDILEEMP